MSTFDLPAALRRIRRAADLSQRELAEQLGASKSAIARVESGLGGLDVRVLARAALLAGLRLALLDDQDRDVPGMSSEAVRDGGGRRFPAHLDIRHSDEGWWHGPHRYDREQPSYTFDRDRGARDRQRRRDGTPDDHQSPQPGDSPQERAATRRREYLRSRAEERQRAFLAGEFAEIDLRFDCTCPDICDELDDRSGKPVHAPGCGCDCDLA